MGDALRMLIMLTVGLLVWAGIGHLLWRLLAAIMRGLFGRRCPRCGRRHLQATCPDCSHGPGAPAGWGASAPNVHSDLAAAKRLIDYSKFQKWLTEEQQHALLKQLNNLAARIQATPGSPATSSAEPPVSRAASAATAEPAVLTAQLPTDQASPAPVPPAPVPPAPVPPATVSPTVSPQLVRSTAKTESAGEVSTRKVGPPPTLRPDVHPLEQPDDPAPPRQRPPARQQLTANLLKSFMEQSNIRWVELISASLIVVCSVGLVISLWSTLSSTSRFFPSLVFLLATLAVHGAGQYTLKQWKLRTTSRGILHIGLMLIPLAVMVGILLSRRGSQLPALDLVSASVIAIGGVVYGGLAYTASKSLFSRRWPLIAVSTLIGSLTLLPTQYLADRQVLGTSQASWALVPLTLVSLWAALAFSRWSLHFRRFAAGSVRRLAGMVTQALFAVLASLVFWVLQARHAGGLNSTWFIAVGVIAAAWASWGWTASLGPRLTSDASHSAARKMRALNAGASWMMIAAWCVASSSTLLLVAALWQVAMSRGTLASLLGLLAVWWLVHGWSCRVRATQIAGALSFLTAVGLMVEGLFVEPHALISVDWLSFSRIMALTTIGLVTLMMTTVSTLLGPARQPSPSGANASPSRLAELLQDMQVASGVVVFAAAMLTVFASLVPLGGTPYGGNWAALLLLAYGVSIIAAAIANGFRESAHPWSRACLPIGGAILLLGTVRLCQTSPMLDSWLSELRPLRSWAIGTALLALLGSWTASWLAMSRTAWHSGGDDMPFLDRPIQRENLSWLRWSSVVLAGLSAIAVWSHADHLRLATAVGWMLPLTAIACFFSWRRAVWREIALLCLGLWVESAVYHLGHAQGWWSELGLAGTSALLVIVMTAVLAAFEGLIWALDQRGPGAAAGPAMEDSWLRGGFQWAVCWLALIAWGSYLTAMTLPAMPHIAKCLGVTALDQPVGFASRPLGSLGVGFALAAAVALVGVSAWFGRYRRLHILTTATGLVAIASAVAVAAWVPPPQTLTAGLWVLAGWLLASESLQFFGSLWEKRSLEAWQRLLEPQQQSLRQGDWLWLGRVLALVVLGLGTVAYAAAVLAGQASTSLLPQANAWLANVGLLLATLGPACVVGLARWGLAIWNSEASRMVTTATLLTALLGGCTSMLAIASTGPAGEVLWAAQLIVLAQATALTAALLVWLALGFVVLRNFLGLRVMLRGKLGQLEIVSKSMKGARWQRVQQASWTVSGVAMALIAALSTSAAVATVMYPVHQLSVLARLGSTALAITAAVTLSLYWFLSVRRGHSRFGLLAITLGLLAPLGTAGYAAWLAADVQRVTLGAADFEPLRLLLVLWLAALAIGLGVRIAALNSGRALSKAGDAAWILLGCLVGGLALISATHDPNPWWPMAELSCLALLGTLSSVASRQVWRGHIAAVAAAAAFSGWLVRSGGTEVLLQLWMHLWGPVWVALVAVLAELIVQHRGSSAHHAGKLDGDEPPRLPSRFRVDQLTSLSLPLSSALLSLGWVAIQDSPVKPASQLTWWVLGLAGASLILSVCRLWDRQPARRGLGVYLNLIAGALVLAISLSSWGELPKLQTWLLWLASGLGAMAILAGLLRELVREASPLSQRLGLASIASPAAFQHALQWMPAAHTVASLFALLPCVLLVLAFEERTLRVAATVLPFIGAVSILPIPDPRGRAVYRYCGLTLISSSLVLLWWADLPSAWAVTDIDGSWLFIQRSFAALSVLGIAYPAWTSLRRPTMAWARPLMHTGWVCLGLGCVAGCLLIYGAAIKQWDDATAAADLGTKLLTIVAWVAVVARLIQFAALPHSIDRGASVPLRKLAVFAAEVGIALACAATYFHFPDLFGGLFVNWWPLVVFGIAMLSAAVGEWMRRIDQPILADPVQQSSLFLPLIPLAGVWWIQPETNDWLWRDWGRYAFLLLTASSLYGLHGWLRNSPRLRAFAGLFALLAFWSFLHSNPSLRFFEHPQFWLLPPALVALAFVEFNRSRLEPSVVVMARYVAVLTAYLSSTSEIFLKAFEGQLWQPMLLLVLALCGVAAGIVLRVRAFLYCGTAFTMVALVGMVWHAQQAIGQVWPWWAFGIATGIALIVLLGYFEKNRPRVVQYLEQLKQWEG